MIQQLLTDFYTELSSTYQPNVDTFSSIIRLNPKHEVYNGHFPQTPVAPGVALIQLVKEILQDKLQTQLQLAEGDNIKFLALINPNETSELQLDFLIKKQNNIIEANVNYSNSGKSYTKFKGKFKIVA